MAKLKLSCKNKRNLKFESVYKTTKNFLRQNFSISISNSTSEKKSLPKESTTVRSNLKLEKIEIKE